MKTFCRLYLASLFLGALLVGGNLACPGLTNGLCVHVEEWLPLQRRIAEHVRHDQELDKERQIVKQRIEKENQVVMDLKAGKLSLLEAAPRFRDLRPPDAETVLYLLGDYYDCCSQEEFYCWSVINWAGLEAAPRLEAELERLAIEGQLTFPEPGIK